MWRLKPIITSAFVATNTCATTATFIARIRCVAKEFVAKLTAPTVVAFALAVDTRTGTGRIAAL